MCAACTLAAWIEAGYTNRLPPDQNPPQRYGIMWDYMSLLQHNPPHYYRNEKEDTLFAKALEQLPIIYAHEHTLTFQLTKFPDNYPKEYNLPKEKKANTKEYYERG